jgi:hypothetical protein
MLIYLKNLIAYGASLVEHCLTVAGFPEKCIIGKNFDRNQGLIVIFEIIIFII